MNPSDAHLFARLERATQGGRALLCTLARRGKALRRDDPARAELLLAASQGHPLYKAGRLLFDLLELEDLMLDGPPPEALDGAELDAGLRQMASAAGDLWQALERFAGEAAAALRTPVASPAAPPVAPPVAPDTADEQAEPRPAPDPPPGAAEPAAAAPPAMASASPAPLPELTAAEYLYDLIVMASLDELSRALATAGRQEPPVAERDIDEPRPAGS